MTNVVIASAARTAVGSFSGAFANTPAHDLGTAVLEAIVESDGDAALGGGADELARKGLAVEGVGEESDEAKPGAEL